MSHMLVKSILTIPNLLTMLRIVGAVSMLFIKKYTVLFYIVFTLCGISDLLDGFIARRTNTVSEFGSRLDSAADLLCYTVVLLRMLPDLWVQVPMKVWYLLWTTILLRVISYGGVALRYHRLASMHTYLNKLTGFLTFILLYFINRPPLAMAAFLAVVAALLSVVEELLIYLYLGGYPEESVQSFAAAIRLKKKRRQAEV